MIQEGFVEEYARVVVSHIYIIVNRLADKSSLLVVCNVVEEKVEHVFGRGTLSSTGPLSKSTVAIKSHFERG